MGASGPKAHHDITRSPPNGTAETEGVAPLDFSSKACLYRLASPHYGLEPYEGARLEQFHGTTILSVRRNGAVVIGGDGQVTMGHTIMKANARKVRRLYRDNIVAGFAGGTADAFTLFERFEAKLEKHQGHLTRAAVELAKDWRTDRLLRRLEALLAVADKTASLILTGNGDVIEPEEGLIAIGSGGPYAQAAARALLAHTSLSAREVVEKSLHIAGDICLYTNHNLCIEELGTP